MKLSLGSPVDSKFFEKSWSLGDLLQSLGGAFLGIPSETDSFVTMASWVGG